MTLKVNILVVSHDAGGAEILSSWLKRKKNRNNLFFILKGPALDIFKKKLGNIKRLQEKNVKNIQFQKILTSTSWNSNIEKKYIKYGLMKKIPTFCFLDHWNYYKERFVNKDKLYLPDVIYVSDKYAFNIAKKTFKKTKIILIKNFYKYDILKKIKTKIKKVNKIINILYVSEPIRQHAIKQHKNPLFWGYDEFSSLKFFFSEIKKYIDQKFIIIFRKHPSENINKYNEILRKYSKNFKIIISKNQDLYKDISRSNIIVGNQSMVMIIGIFAEKKVLSTLPKNSKKLLPHKKIIYMSK